MSNDSKKRNFKKEGKEKYKQRNKEHFHTQAKSNSEINKTQFQEKILEDLTR